MSTTTPTTTQLRRYMRDHAEEHLDCGEVNMTSLGEATADHFDYYERGSDADPYPIPDRVWDLAAETAGWYERQV